MIVFDLSCCEGNHRFEGWFASSKSFAEQRERGLVTCPQCGSAKVDKALMAPRLARKGNQRAEPAPAKSSAPPAPIPGAPASLAAGPVPGQAADLMRKLAVLQTEMLKTSRHVGKTFAEDARAMHYGERDAETIHGQASAEEVRELFEEGIAVLPLPFPVIPPEEAN
jgi:hypothetical protein